MQLTMEMEEGKTSGSSSSSFLDPVNKASGLQTITKHEEASSAEACLTKPGAFHKRRRHKTTARRKWLPWFQMGC